MGDVLRILVERAMAPTGAAVVLIGIEADKMVAGRGRRATAMGTVIAALLALLMGQR